MTESNSPHQIPTKSPPYKPALHQPPLPLTSFAPSPPNGRITPLQTFLPVRGGVPQFCGTEGLKTGEVAQ
ncbi:MAG: hypothetical protein LBP53_06275 [Candidatus Peribacteria bacterium]|nr:hypothetical protein [Candidatus Peribacteria bacterium]